MDHVHFIVEIAFVDGISEPYFVFTPLSTFDKKCAMNGLGWKRGFELGFIYEFVTREL